MTTALNIITGLFILPAMVLAHGSFTLPVKKKFSWYLVIKPEVNTSSSRICGEDFLKFRGQVPPAEREKISKACINLQQASSLYSHTAIKALLSSQGVEAPRLLGSKVKVSSSLDNEEFKKATTVDAETPLVEAGENIKVVYQQGGISIEFFARALQKVVHQGQVIRARSGQRVLKVKVLNHREAVLHGK